MPIPHQHWSCPPRFDPTRHTQGQARWDKRVRSMSSDNTHTKSYLSTDSTSDEINVDAAIILHANTTATATATIPSDQDDARNDSNSGHKAVIRSCLDKTLRVTLTDGRTIEGTLDCFDNSGNMILSTASDITPQPNSARAPRFATRLGIVLVPGHASRNILVARPSAALDSSLADSASNVLNFTESSSSALHANPLDKHSAEGVGPAAHPAHDNVNNHIL